MVSRSISGALFFAGGIGFDHVFDGGGEGGDGGNGVHDLMGKYPDQFLPGCGFLFFQYILDVFNGAQKDHLILHLELGGIDGQLKDILLILNLYQFVFARIDGQQGIGQFFAEWTQSLLMFLRVFTWNSFLAAGLIISTVPSRW